jgi:hypothetical protein
MVSRKFKDPQQYLTFCRAIEWFRENLRILNNILHFVVQRGKHCCGCGPDGFVINWPPKSGFAIRKFDVNPDPYLLFINVSKKFQKKLIS